jgi:hypothetical protein
MKRNDVTGISRYLYHPSKERDHEYKLIRGLLVTKYKNALNDPRFVLIVELQSDYGKRIETDYKLSMKDSVDYFNFMKTDNYSMIDSLVNLRNYFEL